jgi:uncharacterized protein YbdZ (MbtH family)
MALSDLDREDTTIYKVVVNHEEQYSIWPDYKDLPLGWTQVGRSGLKSECLAYIDETWTDMRPLSLRKKMEEFAKNPPLPHPPLDPDVRREKTLVERLCEGDHSVEVALRPERSATLFKEAINRQYVHIRFAQTEGGTELGFPLNQSTSDFSAADFENGKGTVHVEGDLTLDYVKVKCIADIDLSTLTGKGRLARVDTSNVAAPR